MKWFVSLIYFIFPFLKGSKSKGVEISGNNTTETNKEEKGGSEFSQSNIVTGKLGGKTIAREKSGTSQTGEEQKTATGSAEKDGDGKPTGEKEGGKSGQLRSGIRLSLSPYRTSVTGDIDETIFGINTQVNYTPSSKFSQPKPESFPQVYMPTYNTVIKPPVNGKAANKGMTEESFCRDFLMKYFKGKIFDSLTVFHGYSPIEPDLSFIDLTSGKNICIDIEIDEPYDGVNRTPTHYLDTYSGKTSDHERNKGFTERGWMVIRFAEEQIIENPGGCCRFIGEVVKSVYSNFQLPQFSTEPSLEKVKIWTRLEAEEMAKNKKREKYLGIGQFFNSQQPRDYSIQDSALGREIEKEIGMHKNKSQKPTSTKEDIGASKPKVYPPPIISTDSATTKDHKVTKKEEGPSQPAPRPYANN